MTYREMDEEFHCMKSEFGLTNAQAEVLELLWLKEEEENDGYTDDELEQELGWLHQTLSARRRELVQKGFVKDSGKKRPTRSGRGATVWMSVSGTV